MKKLMLSAAVACATLAMPALAFADDTSKGTATTAAAGSMMICRQAAANEKPVAMMADNSKVGLVCKTITADMMAKMKAKQMGPDLSKALTSQQVDDAWRVWLSQMFTVPGTGGG